MQLSSLTPLAVALLTGIIVVSMGSQITGEIRTTQLDVTGVLVSNESTNFASNNTWYQVDEPSIVSVSAMYNDSAHTGTFDAAAYDYNNDLGIRIYTNASTANSVANVTTGTKYFDYYMSLPAYISREGQEGLDEFGSWLPTLALVAAAVVVIGLLLSGFQRFV